MPRKKTNIEWLRERLELKAGLFEFGSVSDGLIKKTLDEFFGPDGIFVQMLRHAASRKVLGIFRYEQKVAGSSYEDRARLGTEKSFVSRAIEKLQCYEKTGNTEYLIDVLNYCALEWSRPFHPNSHFSPTDRTEEFEKGIINEENHTSNQ